MINILEEHDLDSFVTTMIEEPITNARTTNYNKNQENAKRIIYDFMKDNLMLVITPLKMEKECFDTLTDIYENKAPTQKRALKNKLCKMTMERDEFVASFFTKISKVKDQLESISVDTDEDDLLQTAIDRIPFSWDTFLTVVNGREESPKFKRIWHNCIQE